MQKHTEGRPIHGSALGGQNLRRRLAAPLTVEEMADEDGPLRRERFDERLELRHREVVRRRREDDRGETAAPLALRKVEHEGGIGRTERLQVGSELAGSEV